MLNVDVELGLLNPLTFTLRKAFITARLGAHKKFIMGH